MAHLDPKFGYFKAQSYRLVFEMKGHPSTETTISSSVSGWYFGNLLFGGLIGMLIVDPSTGAMFNLEPEKVAVTLTPSQAQVIRSHQGIMVMLTSPATDEQRAQMVRVH